MAKGRIKEMRAVEAERRQLEVAQMELGKKFEVLEEVEKLLEGMEEPTWISSRPEGATISYYEREQEGYLAITRDWRKLLGTGTSKFEEAYGSQILRTEGTIQDLKISVQVDVGLRESCRVEYYDEVVKKSRIVCE